MFLGVDTGNTQSSFGIFQNGTLTHHWTAETKVSRTPDEYASLLLPLLAHHHLKMEWEGVALCSVVPPADAPLIAFCQKYLNQDPFRVTTRLPLDFELNVLEPHEVGADRIANATYALEYLSLPAIVIDFGTATTFDVVSVERKYEGGVILPGVRLAFESLGANTSKLPTVAPVFPNSVIGKTTADCIQAGILYGYCDQIQGLLERTISEIGKGCDVAITGGLASLFQDKLKTKLRLAPHLTLEGIRILYERYGQS